jgi:DNA-binding transcriptional LysR family regulator
MELTQLAQFKAIAECQSISQAAEKIYISQPSLSASLRKLEDELGVRLFERRKGRIFLNDAGVMALSHINIILEQVEKMKAELGQYKRKGNTFSIAFCDPGPMWYSMPRFSLAHPECEITYHRFDETENDNDLLLSGSYDIVFSSRHLTHPDIQGFLFIRDQLLLSVPASHLLAKETEIELRKIKNLHEPLAFFNGMGSFNKRQFPFWAEMNTIIERIFYDDREIYGQIIRTTGAPTISTRLARLYRNDGEGRVLIPLIDSEFSIDYYICYLSENEKRLLPFITWAQQCAKDFEIQRV